MVHLHPLDRLRLQRGAEHLHALGARAQAEFLVEIGSRIGGLPAIFSLLREYEVRLSPQMLRAIACHPFPPRSLHLVPVDPASTDDAGAAP
jgi:hypothetical protein